MHLLAALTHQHGTVAGQRLVPLGSSEIAEFEPLLAGVDLTGTGSAGLVVTADALHTTRTWAGLTDLTPTQASPAQIANLLRPHWEIDRTRLDGAVRELATAGVEAIGVVCDITDKASVEQLAYAISKSVVHWYSRFLCGRVRRAGSAGRFLLSRELRYRDGPSGGQPRRR